ncbi:hypothetical protein [Pararhizobium antarcticum]|uniref:Uncharacterized protein n=1 Tax=Pararhizobium antarcticum TaxID=1798805 RepID=A0A657LXC0_9HYPH|nr:hypothetical protein [Pararhizobium antarcticum]OJF97591.1 hypothetical protein AX760_16640 [Pararhizobium antarcticum]
MAEMTMEIPRVTLAIKVRVPRGYKLRMALMFACFRMAEIVAPHNVLVEIDCQRKAKCQS